MDATAAAVADPVRREILERLAERPLTAGQVAAGFDISRPAVSRHLRVLREAGLVVDEAQGRRRVYALRPEPLAELERWLAGFGRRWEQRLDALETEVHRTRRDRRDRAARPASPIPQEESA